MREYTEDEKEVMKLRYYDEDIHRSAFVLPRKVKKVAILFAFLLLFCPCFYIALCFCLTFSSTSNGLIYKMIKMMSVRVSGKQFKLKKV